MSDQRRRRRREEEERQKRQLELERRRRIARQRKRRRQVMKRRLILASIGMVLLLAAIIAGVVTIRGKIAEKKAQEAKAKKQQEEEAARLEEENNTLHMVAVGDNMIHDAIIQAGKKNDWNFDFLYENVKEDIENADVAIVNQETPFVKSHSAAAGYPDFATPTEVGDALAAAGFDVVTHATEHSFDQGSDGIINSTSFWKKNYPEITRLGIHSDEKEKNYEICNVKNFKIALLNYSTLLSENHKVKKDETYMINLYSEERAKADIKEAKEEADLTVVMLHGGKSDSTEPDEKLLDRVSFLSEQGADIILCSHPHILKGYELLTREDKGKTLVYYSLGNFVSGQTELKNLLGGMADFTIKKDAESGKISIEDYSLVPLVMHYNSDFSEAGMYKLSDYTEELASEHASHKQDSSDEDGSSDGQESDDGEEDTDTGFSLRALEKAADAIGELKDGQAQEDEDSTDEDSQDDEDIRR
nr:CapA family protein [uncultured Blautia sp.]